MKKYWFLLAALSLTFAGQAQLRLGIKAGLSTTDVKAEELDLLDQGGAKRLGLALKDAKYGVQVGLALQANIGSFVLQPEFNFNSNTVEWSVTDVNNPGIINQVFKEKYQYLDIPLMLGFRIGPLRLQAGPEGHVFLNSTSDLFKFDEYEQNFSNLTVGWLGGAGLDLWNLALDLRYQGNFNKFGDHIRFAGRDYEFSNTPARWMGSVTWFFNKRNRKR